MQVIASSFGNLELIVLEGGVLAHYYRANADPVHPWYRTTAFGGPATSAPSLIQSNFGGRGNFELVVREGDQLRHYWRDNDDPTLPWYQGALFGSKASSAPALIQGSLGSRGNFEIVVYEGDRLRHYWRDNDDPALPWYCGQLIGSNLGGAFPLVGSDESYVSAAPALMQSNFGGQGNFEVVVCEWDPSISANRLRHYYRDNDVGIWCTGVLLSDYIKGMPSLLQSSFGAQGNFELLTMRGWCLVHFWRDNDSAGFPWSEEIETHAVPPAGRTPTPDEASAFQSWWPNLRNFNITEDANLNTAYNCIAWSVGVTDQAFWPGDEVSAFDTFYASYGWVPSANGHREFGKRKIALWAAIDNNGHIVYCTHASRETRDCEWHESKCGYFMGRIMHDRYQMQGGYYGQMVRFYEKAEPGANVDLTPGFY